METSTRVVRTVHLDVDRRAAWDLVGTQDGLARWLGGDVVLDPTVGAALRVRDDDGGERVGTVVEVDDGRALTFEWADDEGAASTVTFTVEEDGEGSRVTVVEEAAGGSIAACLDAGAAWEHRMLHLEVGALALRSAPAFLQVDDDERVGAVFSALADPTRRAVLRAVADQGHATATDLGLAVGVTRQAAAKHLDQLAAAGLVVDERAGRERLWRVRTRPMADAAAWLTATGSAWDTRLARLVDAARAPRPGAGTPQPGDGVPPVP